MAVGEVRKVVVEVVPMESEREQREKHNKSEAEKFFDKYNNIRHPIRSFIEYLNDKSRLAGFATEKAINFVQQSVVTEASRYFTLKEDYIAQNAADNVRKVASTAMSMLDAGVSGAMAGAKGGIAGALIGAAIGITSQGISSAFQATYQYDSYMRDLNETVMQTNYNASRASLIDSSRNTEN